METTGGRVGAAAKLSAGVELGEHDLKGRHLAPGMQTDRNTAAIIRNLNRFVTMQGQIDLVGEASGRLIDGVVDQLPHKMHQPIRASAPDIHTRTFTNSLQPLKGLDGISVIAGTGLVRGHRANVAPQCDGAVALARWLGLQHGLSPI